MRLTIKKIASPEHYVVQGEDQEVTVWRGNPWPAMADANHVWAATESGAKGSTDIAEALMEAVDILKAKARHARYTAFVESLQELENDPARSRGEPIVWFWEGEE